MRHGDGQIYVLEDNLRVPSGVSYVLENRASDEADFSARFRRACTFVRWTTIPASCWRCSKRSRRQGWIDKPTVVLLTPGMYNSAYFEHSFLAQQMGIQLVEGRDLAVQDKSVLHADDTRASQGRRDLSPYRRRLHGPASVSQGHLLGVPGLLEAYRAGNVALANAPGNGVADDKVVYAYVPDMIRYYLGEDAILPNVPTFLCWRDTDRQHVLQNLDKLVVKAANEAGGYGMLVGPHSTAGTAR